MRVYHDSRTVVAAPDWSTPSLMKPHQLADWLSHSALTVEWKTVVPIDWREFEEIHAPSYVDAVRTGTPAEVAAAATVEWSPELAEGLRWETGSMVGAALCSLESGSAVSFSSGFHHAHYASAGTFCLLNGLVLAALRAIQSGLSRPVLILDCDYHYGNGTDDILGRFVHDPGISIAHHSLGRTFSTPKDAGKYLEEIDRIGQRIAAGEFGLTLYQAGMDVLLGDPSGGILTYEQTFARDRQVFRACHASGTPIAWNLAGGYSTDSQGSIAPVLQGHMNTLIAFASVYEGFDADEPWFPTGTDARANTSGPRP